MFTGVEGIDKGLKERDETRRLPEMIRGKMLKTVLVRVRRGDGWSVFEGM